LCRQGLAGSIRWPVSDPVFVAELIGAARPGWSPRTDRLPAGPVVHGMLNHDADEIIEPVREAMISARRLTRRCHTASEHGRSATAEGPTTEGGGRSELEELGVRRCNAHAMLAALHKHGDVPFDANHPAHAVLVVGHAVV